jgi:Immunity protein 52
MYWPELIFSWGAHEPSTADDARRLSRFVTGLSDFDPIYQSWLASPAPVEEAVPVPLTETDARQLLVDNMARYDSPDLSWPEMGSFFAAGHAGAPPFDFRLTSYAETDCHIGAYSRSGRRGANHISMRLSNLRPSTGRPWRASELRPLMKFAREVWNPTELWASFSFLSPAMIADSSWAAGDRLLRPPIGWITYLPANLASRAKYPADVEVETLNDGSVLVTLCEEPFEKDDAEGMARLRALEAALRPIQT